MRHPDADMPERPVGVPDAVWSAVESVRSMPRVTGMRYRELPVPSTLADYGIGGEMECVADDDSRSFGDAHMASGWIMLLYVERDREDCLAEVLMRIWDGIGGYDPERGSWRAYIPAAARNAALTRARAERVHTAGLPDGVSAQPGPEEAVIAAEEIDELRRAIDALPPGDRALIYRKYYYRQSTAQMASALGLTARAVEGRLYRIKKRLGAALGGERNG